MSRLIPDTGPCHQHLTRLNHSGPVLGCFCKMSFTISVADIDPIWRLLESTTSVLRLQMSWQPSAHFLQIFSCVNVTSVSASSYPAWSLQTILQTIPITLLGAQTCNALLLLLTLLSIISWKFYFLDSFIIKVYYLVLFGYNQTISILQN